MPADPDLARMFGSTTEMLICRAAIRDSNWPVNRDFPNPAGERMIISEEFDAFGGTRAEKKASSSPGLTNSKSEGKTSIISSYVHYRSFPLRLDEDCTHVGRLTNDCYSAREINIQVCTRPSVQRSSSPSYARPARVIIFLNSRIGGVGRMSRGTGLSSRLGTTLLKGSTSPINRKAPAPKCGLISL